MRVACEGPARELGMTWKRSPRLILATMLNGESILRRSRGSVPQERPNPGIIASAFVRDRHRVVEQQIPSLRFSTIIRMQFEGRQGGVPISIKTSKRRLGRISLTRIKKILDDICRSCRGVNNRSKLRVWASLE